MSLHLNMNLKRRSTQNSVISAKRGASVIEKRKPPTQMKITDLDNDCLEHVFKYLHIEDLLNVSDSRKCLKVSVDQAFRSKYEKYFVIPMLFDENHEYGTVTLKTTDQKRKIEKLHNFGTVLKFLRCFGELISIVQIDFDSLEGQPKKTNQLCRYIKKYCAKTCAELDLTAAPNGIISLSEPFINVGTLCLSTKFEDQCIDVKRCFPKLCCLKLFIDSIPKSLEVHLPHLEDLIISSQMHEWEKVKRILRLNLQVQELDIYGVNDFSILEVVSQCYQLKAFHIKFTHLQSSLRSVIESFINLHPTLDKMTIEIKDQKSDMLENIFSDISGWIVSKYLFCALSYSTEGIDLVRKTPASTAIEMYNHVESASTVLPSVQTGITIPERYTPRPVSLLLHQIPGDLNSIAHLYEHFRQFGTLIDIQNAHEGDPEAALVTFSTHNEASAAYNSIVDGCFIKVLWHTPDSDANPNVVYC